MSKMSRSDIAWLAGISLIAVTVNPFLKSIGLLPADVLRSYGIVYPGVPQLVFGPLMAFLLLLGYIKTGQPLIFPLVGVLRALSLGFVFPANPAHLGTGLAGILAGVIAARSVTDVGEIRFAIWLPALAGLYAGSYAAGNYITTLLFGPVAQIRIIVLSPHQAIGVVVGSLFLGVLAGAGAYVAMRAVAPQASLLSSRSLGAV